MAKGRIPRSSGTEPTQAERRLLAVLGTEPDRWWTADEVLASPLYAGAAASSAGIHQNAGALLRMHYLARRKITGIPTRYRITAAGADILRRPTNRS